MSKLIRASKQLPHARTPRTPARSAAPARDNPVALRRPRPRRRSEARPRGSGYHPPRLRPRDQKRRGRRCGHLRRCGPGGLLANSLSRKPLPISERACELGAAYRNRTDDLRVTRGPVPRSRRLTCTDSTADRTGSAGSTGISRLPVPRPVPRLSHRPQVATVVSSRTLAWAPARIMSGQPRIGPSRSQRSTLGPETPE